MLPLGWTSALMLRPAIEVLGRDMEAQSMKYDLRRENQGDYEFCYELTKQNMYDLFCRHWDGWLDSEFRKGFVVDNIQIIKSGR